MQVWSASVAFALIVDLLLSTYSTCTERGGAAGGTHVRHQGRARWVVRQAAPRPRALHWPRCRADQDDRARQRRARRREAGDDREPATRAHRAGAAHYESTPRLPGPGAPGAA